MHHTWNLHQLKAIAPISICSVSSINTKGIWNEARIRHSSLYVFMIIFGIICILQFYRQKRLFLCSLVLFKTSTFVYRVNEFRVLLRNRNFDTVGIICLRSQYCFPDKIRGDLVVQPFWCSGKCWIAAKQLNRKWVYVVSNEANYEWGSSRINKREEHEAIRIG